MTAEAAAACRREGDLQGAIDALTQSVKARPADTALRMLLAEHLMLNGDLERADRLFDLAGTQDPSWIPMAALGRQLVRAEQARQDFYRTGGLPELLAEPTPAVETALKAVVMAREGAAAEALALLESGPEPDVVRGTYNGAPFDGVCDLDPLTAPVLEVLANNGRFFWIPWSRVREIVLKPIERVRDIGWRPAEVEIIDGPTGVVYLPAIYPFSATAEARLGRMTDWVETDGLSRGAGQRCLLVGDEEIGLHDLQTLSLQG